MKKVLLIAVALLATITVNAQAKKYLNFGGLGTGLYAGYEIPVSQVISIVPQASVDYNFNKLILSCKGNFYLDDVFGINDSWDTYAGLNAGWRLYDNNDNGNGAGFAWGIHIGGRWFWSDKWGINAEIGGGSGVLGGVGVTMAL